MTARWKGEGITREEVVEFEAVQAQMGGLYDEVDKLAAKRPNDALNKFKLGVVNNLLRRANRLVGQETPLRDFQEFSEESIPTNSDVLMVLSQYLGYLEKIRADNIADGGYLGWFWLVGGERSDIRTAPPRKIKG